jgi:hypothetical protein
MANLLNGGRLFVVLCFCGGYLLIAKAEILNIRDIDFAFETSLKC